MGTIPRTRCVADAMVARPVLHGPRTTAGELREFFRDDHVHLALVVEAGTLVTTVERADLEHEPDGRPARVLGRLPGRTTRAGVPVADAYETMRRLGRRRLAVTDEAGSLLGLLCLKARGDGFCSDEDVAARRGGAWAGPEPRPQVSP